MGDTYDAMQSTSTCKRCAGLTIFGLYTSESPRRFIPTRWCTVCMRGFHADLIPEDVKLDACIAAAEANRAQLCHIARHL